MTRPESLRGARETIPDLAIDRCSALLAAGLAEEAARRANSRSAGYLHGEGDAFRNAELLSLPPPPPGRGQPGCREGAGASGAPVVPAQERAVWETRADLVTAQAGMRWWLPRPLPVRRAAAAGLEMSHADEAIQAHLLPGASR